ncbi:MAG TPA: sigma 54-interacting transcriptional regulator, partial [Terriglobia bacterium]|nr:sigma 54-interacting transcriptional regulator [Terriglobia bacterium]
EIGETSLGMQVKLLRVLQERRVRPLGGNADVPVDVRLIATTHRDLKKMVEQGTFREDFFYRVSVIPIEVPPLRERRDDIERLARHFLERFGSAMQKPVHDFEAQALAALLNYDWPGNVRELEHAIERAVAVSTPQDRMVRFEHLPSTVAGGGQGRVEPEAELGEAGIDFEAAINTKEKRYLLEALKLAGGNRTRAAELLHMSYRSYRHFAEKHGV